MEAFRRVVLHAGVLSLALGAGCAGHDRDALYQPIEPNYANPADPLERQIEDQRALDARGRTEAPVQLLLQREADPEDPDDE